MLLSSFAIFTLSSKHQQKNIAFLLALSLLLPIFVFELMRFVSFYFQGEGFNARFFFHLSWNSLLEAGAAYLLLITAVIFLLSLFVVLIYQCTIRKIGKKIPYYFAISALPLCLLLNFALKEFVLLQFFPFGIANTSFDISKLQEMGLNPTALEKVELQASSGKNLVFIYLESLENIYLEEEIFPGLTPNIQQLANNGLRFTDIQQTPGTEWTIAGIFASQCGTPLVYGNSIISGNDIIQNGYLKHAVCLSDLLHQAGYKQYYIGGASVRFAGKSDFYKNHHYDQVLGYDELINELPDKTYKTGWGLYDDSLFTLSVQTFERLAKEEQLFNLTILTIDTHQPAKPSHSCSNYSALQNKTLDAVHCTDQLVNNFIKRISKHPAFKNTIVVLFSDHLAMMSRQKIFPPEYHRKLFFALLNGDKKGLNTRQGSHMDIVPTTLAALGIKHNAAFLAGNNLLATEPQKTLVDFKNAEVQQAIRHVNKNFFSKDYSLCQDNQLLLKMENSKSLRIGNQILSLSSAGIPATPQRYTKDLAILAYLDDSGKIENASSVHFNSLPYLLTRSKDSIFLLITPNKELPYGLDNFTVSEHGIKVLIGKFNGSIFSLGKFKNLHQLQIPGENCHAILQKTKIPTRKNHPQPKLDSLCIEKNQFAAHYDRKNKHLIIPKVALPDGLISSTLVKESEKYFSLHSFSPIKEEITKADNCIAYYVNNLLYIPSLLIKDGDNEKKIAPLEMKMILKHSYIFEIRKQDIDKL
ncbi:sulfatase-like hydrolase/transferase [Candidatus Venteria ishoeyi]|uniref:sulfatase-like hydrolase/transferase n=1 Tax=Candidatus Venteria ishoeyi TaxID=1899563 RepID=UPI0025A4FF39|nr:sulfatase-like hydrolase/transferase [Candidatus Venteria ishoeyi]MDM8547535.1 sulfatase-like hydrolase/transferase [Candidatus Venteria ishoeyi]